MNGKKAFKFRLSSTSLTGIADAEVLFRDLKNRDPRIQHLWSHQADIIREYHKAIDHTDIALELPTGTGKTLVGLLIGEWRRLTLGERVVYLCPTRQLAHQVVTKAAEYGIKTHVFVGPQNQYAPAHFSAYASANAIAVTTYSGLFNTNPKIDNPETIILDDAHAGENYIARMWSISISRFEHRDLYDQVIDLYEDELPDYLIPDLLDDDASPYQKRNLDLLPGPRFARKIQGLTDLIDASANGDNQLVYPWQLVRGKMNACCAFFSWSEILIRPSIPPTFTHPPFANARQRVYMSATLGAGGELERIAGIPKIHRIPAPPGWDKQSTGRRLFVFPDRSFTADEYQLWMSEFVGSKERSLVLTPHRLALSSFEELITESGVEHEILHSGDVETSLDAFTDKSNTILALTNRYDGIDLPGDTCRSLVVYGLPASVNLYERFLWSKLGLITVLRDRIRTRITQAVGRCTRSSTDYAVVLMVGEDLLDFCIKRENRAELHPELRAEMEFGLDNSDTLQIDDLTSLVDLFLNRSPAWESAETDITKRRNDVTVVNPPYIETLRSVVDLEVMYQYDLWKADYSAALDKSTNIVDRLSGDELAGYRSLWNYFAGCAAYYLGEMTGNNEILQTASDRFHRASQSSQAILWFATLSHELDPQKATELSGSILTILAADSVNRYLTNVGTIGKRFDKMIGEYRKLIEASDADGFDRALTELGKMLGFDAEKPEGQGLPDSVWRLGSSYVLLFECKSDETPAGGISIRTCRQAQGHQSWQKARPFFTQSAEMITIVVSPRKLLDKDAVPHADGLFYLHVDSVRSMFGEAEACLRSIRSKSPDLETEQRLQLILTDFSSAKLTPDQVKARVTQVRLLDLERQ